MKTKYAKWVTPQTPLEAANSLSIVSDVLYFLSSTLDNQHSSDGNNIFAPNITNGLNWILLTLADVVSTSENILYQNNTEVFNHDRTND